MNELSPLSTISAGSLEERFLQTVGGANEEAKRTLSWLEEAAS